MKFAFINTGIVFHIIDPTVLHFQHQIQSGVAEGIDLSRCTCDYYDSTLDLEKFLRTKRHQEYDGIIGIIGWSNRARQAAWNELERRLPCVNATAESYYPDSNFIGVDDRAGMRAVMDHLHEEGLRRIGYFGFRWQSYSFRRYAEYRSSMARFSLPIDPAWLYGPCTGTDDPMGAMHECMRTRGRRYRQPHEAEVIEAFRSFFARGAFPEAIVLETDYYASLFHQSARKAGVRIPDDIAIAGFDDSHLLFPPHGYAFLTTVRQDFREIGKGAVQMLHEIVRGKRPPKRQRILTAPQLIVRISSRRTAYNEQASDRFISTVLAYIDRNYADDHLSERLAAGLSLSGRYFLSKFNRIIGEPFASFVNNYRVDKAAYYIRNTNKPITDILWDVGFHSNQNFNRIFTRRMGMTPMAYRKRQRKAVAQVR